MSTMARSLLALALLGLATAALGKPWWLRGVETNETDFLPPDVAFRVTARLDGSVVKVRWVIADGYYLYRHKFAVAAESPDLLVAGIILPRGTRKTDSYLGTQEVFTQQVEGVVPFRRFDYGAHPLEIRVTYQGCAEAGLCYPPISKVLFPQVEGAADSTPATTDTRWEGYAISAGVLAFFLAGLTLRKGRRLDAPPA